MAPAANAEHINMGGLILEQPRPVEAIVVQCHGNNGSGKPVRSRYYGRIRH